MHVAREQQVAGAPAPLPGSNQLLEERENAQRAQQLHLDQTGILQGQGTLKPLDPVTMARDNAAAMEKAMGGQYVPQPDVPRDAWADAPVVDWPADGGGDDLDEAFGSVGSDGLATIVSSVHPMAGVAPMSVDQQPRQTYAPPEVRAEQEAILAEINDKAKTASRSQADKAAGGKQSPARTSSPDQVLAELKARPQRESK